MFLLIFGYTKWGRAAPEARLLSDRPSFAQTCSAPYVANCDFLRSCLEHFAIRLPPTNPRGLRESFWPDCLSKKRDTPYISRRRHSFVHQRSLRRARTAAGQFSTLRASSSARRVSGLAKYRPSRSQRNRVPPKTH